MTYQIAAGHNNTAGLVDFDSLVTANGDPFFAPRAFTNVLPGRRVFRGDGSVTISGFPSQVWDLSAGYFAHYEFLKTTYCGSGDVYSGLVTIRTRLYTYDTFANYNAVLILPFPSELEALLGGFRGFNVRMTRLVAI